MDKPRVVKVSDLQLEEVKPPDEPDWVFSDVFPERTTGKHGESLIAKVFRMLGIK